MRFIRLPQHASNTRTHVDVRNASYGNMRKMYANVHRKKKKKKKNRWDNGRTSVIRRIIVEFYGK